MGTKGPRSEEDALVDALSDLLADGLDAFLSGDALELALSGRGRGDGLSMQLGPSAPTEDDPVTQPAELEESLSASERIPTTPSGRFPPRPAVQPLPEPPVLRTRVPATATVYSDTAVPLDRVTTPSVADPASGARDTRPVLPAAGPAVVQATAPRVPEEPRVIVSRGGAAIGDPDELWNEVTPTLVPVDKAGVAASISDTVREQVALIRSAVAAARDGDVERAAGLLANASALGDDNGDVYAAMAWTALFQANAAVDVRVGEAGRLLGLAVSHSPSPWGEGLVRLCRERIAVLVSRTSPSQGD